MELREDYPRVWKDALSSAGVKRSRELTWNTLECLGSCILVVERQESGSSNKESALP